jgi:pimeloyl-ACP methyl ester carboxylesterase
VLAVLNGVLGDYLAEIESPLAIAMSSRVEGEPGPKMLVLVHGSAMSDHQWLRRGHDHGAALARDLGFSPVYVHYNSGLHISTNGRLLAAHLETVVAGWPVPLEEIALLGHSMGGLVARSACHAAEADALAWRKKLRRLVCLGSPHHGSPLERGGNWIDALLGVSAYSAPLARLGKIRSAGVTDMRFGSVLDEHWEGRARFDLASDTRRPLPLPAGVDCFTVAASTARELRPKLPGDGLVPVDSALGRHVRGELTLQFPEAHRSIALGTGHLDLLDRAEVYETIRRWLVTEHSRL